MRSGAIEAMPTMVALLNKVSRHSKRVLVVKLVVVGSEKSQI